MNIFPKTISDKIVYHKEYTYCDPILVKILVYLYTSFEKNINHGSQTR